ncbi:TonB-dependent receptor [Novosphingobium sp. BW1]|uniref:TonB-dependent receptor n=1 Tax=Novosphingobium sp. BW1 TaxID=2592621 RepID=UPI0011DEB2F9|nr:TonB-dependent receptor [Novosphingobium sp. BW1]TYC79102.1 TonB-dependent receptor [Novosphingobium sp. BW1]
MKTSLIAVAAVLVTATPALADEADDSGTDSSDAILVVGQHQRQIEIEPRGLAVSLGDEQFAGINAFNTEDLMKYAPDFFVRKRYSGDSNGVPGFRGTHSTQSARTLVMVDGFVVSNFLGNSFTYSPKWGVVGPGEVQQFDIVYGPYSSRYVGNSMGGIVNITTREPRGTEAFVNVQGFVQPYRQFSTRENYWGGSVEGGFGLKQKDGPWSLRVTGRYFRNEGQPMGFYGLAPGGAAGPVVTGAVVDPKQQEAAAAGTGIAGAPGTATKPIFAAQSPALITQKQAKARIGYDDGTITGELLFAYWNNRDDQHKPDCYLRDAAGHAVCGDTQVTFGGVNYKAAGANWSRTERDEYLLGGKVAADLGSGWDARLALSTYQIARQKGCTSNGYDNGENGGPGKLSEAGPTGWYTGDLTIERKGAVNDVALGATASFYRIDTLNTTLANWTSDTGKAFSSETYGKTRILSGWAEDVLHLSPTAQVTAGLRFDDWRAYDGGLGRLGTTAPNVGLPVYNSYASRHETALNPTLSGQVDLGGTLVQLSLAMATRFPTVGELFQGSLNGDGTFNLDSFDPNLKPERSKDANLLVSRAFGPVKLTGSLFYQRVENTIFQFFGFNQNGVSISNYKNIDLTRQWGLEGIVETHDWPVAGMAFEGNVAWIDSKTLRNPSDPASEGVQFPRIPYWRINANLRYDFTDKVQGSLGMRYASRPNTDLDGTQRGDTFGYTSELFALDARLNWQLDPHLRLSAGVDNITNDRAWVYHPYPQRTFVVEAGWKL